MTDTPKIEVEGLYKVFGRDPDAALKAYADGRSKAEIQKDQGAVIGVADASFSVNEGEIFVVMGLSGSGKSTLVRLLNRLIEPTRGTVKIDGEDIVSASDERLREVRREKIAMVFQSFALMPHLTVIDNAAYGLKIAGVGKTERRKRAADALEAVGLSANLHNYPDALSGGMRQRVGLARALAVNPDIMLMDEAFSALDPLIRAEMQDELLRLQDEQRRTIVFISHDLDEAIRIGDRIAIMEGGRIVQIGTPEEIVSNPANDYVASFFRNVDVSQVLTVGEVAQKSLVTVFERPGMEVGAALERLDEYGHHYGVIVDKGMRYRGVVFVDELLKAKKEKRDLASALDKNVEPLSAATPLNDVMDRIAESANSLPVVDDKGRYCGALSKTLLIRALSRSDDEVKPAVAAE